MKLTLEKDINYDTMIEDFGVEPINRRIITTGDKLIFWKKGKIEKEITRKIKKSNIIKYIKEKNQLFVSSMFFVSNNEGKVYKCDGNKKKIVEEVLDLGKDITAINFTTNGRIIYIYNGILFSYDTRNKELISNNCITDEIKGGYRLFTSGENVILKYQKIGDEENRISIFEDKLKKIFEIKTENTHTFSKIVGIKYLGGTKEGEIEVWNILEKELYDSIKLSDSQITYIEEIGDKYVIGLETGELLITDDKFEVLMKKKITDDKILKICVLENDIYVLTLGNKILELKMIEEK